MLWYRLVVADLTLPRRVRADRASIDHPNPSRCVLRTTRRTTGDERGVITTTARTHSTPCESSGSVIGVGHRGRSSGSVIRRLRPGRVRPDFVARRLRGPAGVLARARSGGRRHDMPTSRPGSRTWIRGSCRPARSAPTAVEPPQDDHVEAVCDLDGFGVEINSGVGVGVGVGVGSIGSTPTASTTRSQQCESAARS